MIIKDDYTKLYSLLDELKVYQLPIIDLATRTRYLERLVVVVYLFRLNFCHLSNLRPSSHG